MPGLGVTPEQARDIGLISREEDGLAVVAEDAVTHYVADDAIACQHLSRRRNALAYQMHACLEVVQPRVIQPL